MLTKKHLGQHFLQSAGVIQRIVKEIDADIVYEIGPGRGALTEAMLAGNKQVIAIEIDKECVNILSQKYANQINAGRLRLVHADILTYDIPHDAIVIGNLPYNIGTKIIEKFVHQPITIGVFMLQKEVAQRIEENCRLGLFVQARYNVKKIIDVSNHCFIPKPAVVSRVIRLTQHNKWPNINYEQLNQITRILFANPRKKISHIKKMDQKLFEQLVNNGIDINKRPNEINKDVIFGLANS
jgi:16S rRNA (adenine1518-N6/adenine1519-N6)-dimethyltransferase